MKQTVSPIQPEATPICGLMNEGQVAQMLGISIASLRRWRLLRKGPKYVKVGAAVRYLPVDLTAWIASRPTGGEQIKGTR
jgi:predicted DNA-binding transcriptional regulator AlpA